MNHHERDAEKTSEWSTYNMIVKEMPNVEGVPIFDRYQYNDFDNGDTLDVHLDGNVDAPNSNVY